MASFASTSGDVLLGLDALLRQVGLQAFDDLGEERQQILDPRIHLSRMCARHGRCDRRGGAAGDAAAPMYTQCHVAATRVATHQLLGVRKRRDEILAIGAPCDRRFHDSLAATMARSVSATARRAARGAGAWDRPARALAATFIIKL